MKEKMTKMISIRPYRAEDKAQLIQLIRSNTPEYFAPEEEADFVSYLDNEIEDYFVVERNEEIVGCGGVNYAENRSVGIISWGMIHPELHGNRIGTVLLQYRLDFLKNTESVKRITVRTSQLTYRFYEKNGFRLVDTKKDFWAEGLDLCYMEYDPGHDSA